MAADAALVADVLGVGAAVVALWVGALLFVRGAAGLAAAVGVPPLVVGLTVVGFGTSAPELVTSVDAALVGRPDVAVGNVVGSNLFNFGIVLGGVLLLGAVPVAESLRRRDGPAVVIATVALALVLADLRLTRPEGLALLALFVGYLAVLLRGTLREAGATAEARALDSAMPDASGRVGLLVRVVVGLGLILFGADLLVRSAVDLARLAGLSEWVIGETVVAAGTSAPEIAASLVAARRGLGDVAVGNLVGSNVFNGLVVLGAAGLVAPATVTPAAIPTVVWLVGLTLVVAGFLWTGSRFARAEGVVCLLANGGRWVLDLLGRGVAG
ncbi:calcium/sodium antiporter [Haloglomus litoreum]|uniref:calcium/sodium antiporter n=1 Tax=Haloglomus litoreum TaxID=3034026 RepID=UPI0023E87B38|nr:calcium/sodium antiporter [Haloglomus sp. DT116]